MSLTDKNLYAYCDNNPVMRSDSGGAFWLTSIVIGIGIKYIVDVVDNVIDGKRGIDALKPTSSVGEYIAAGVTALIPGAGIVSALARSAINETVSVVENAITGEENDPVKSIDNILKNTLIDVGIGLVSKNVSKKLDTTNIGTHSKITSTLRRKNPHMNNYQMSSKMRIIRDRNYEFNTFCLFSFELIRERLGR